MRSRGKALVVGNGINLAAGLTPSWADVVKDLFGIPRSDPLALRMEVTPFPLLIEEATNPPFAHAGERKVQRRLASELKSWAPSSLHAQVLDLGLEHIISTNYDMTLEQASGQPFAPEAPFIAETRYSLFRRYVLHDGTKIWHPHGSILAPNTMVLGFEHYSGHLQAIREVVVNKRHYKDKSYGPLKEVIPSQSKREPESWVEILLTHDVVMVGLSLDFAELGFWWLLTYRARRRNLGRGHLPDTRIVFVTRKEGEDKNGKAAARKALLERCGVEVLEQEGEWVEVYKTAFDRVKEL